MSESMNLAPAVFAIVDGNVPKELYGLAVLSAAGVLVLVALVLDWVKGPCFCAWAER